MIESRVTTASLGFFRVTDAIERKARLAVEAAAEEAAAVAQASASIDLEIDVEHARGTFEGFAAGIKSRKHGVTSRDGVKRRVPLAHFFDQGTLAGRTKPLKGHDRRKRDTSRGGIPAEGFFDRARRAGRKRLIETLRR